MKAPQTGWLWTLVVLTQAFTCGCFNLEQSPSVLRAHPDLDLDHSPDPMQIEIITACTTALDRDRKLHLAPEIGTRDWMQTFHNVSAEAHISGW